MSSSSPCLKKVVKYEKNWTSEKPHGKNGALEAPCVSFGAVDKGCVGWTGHNARREATQCLLNTTFNAHDSLRPSYSLLWPHSVDFYWTHRMYCFQLIELYNQCAGDFDGGESANVDLPFVTVPSSACSLYHVQTLYIEIRVQKFSCMRCDQIFQYLFFIYLFVLIYELSVLRAHERSSCACRKSHITTSVDVVCYMCDLC